MHYIVAYIILHACALYFVLARYTIYLKVHNEELNDLYFSSNIFRVIKSRRMRWAGHVVRMGERRCVYRFWWGNLRESDRLGDPGVDGRIILRWNSGIGMWG
jgi:hypothetical protein